MRPLFATYGFRVIDLIEAGLPEIPEEEALEAFDTFEENARTKARHFHRRSGLATIADDSGLAVEALAGAPGVHSKRWSGRTDLSGQALDAENNRLLLSRLETATNRRAKYVCAAAYVDGSREFVCSGQVAGSIGRAPRGTGGFGYDPYFVADELGKSFGEASREDKERVSHRGRAFRALIAQIVSPSPDRLTS